MVAFMVSMSPLVATTMKLPFSLHIPVLKLKLHKFSFKLGKTKSLLSQLMQCIQYSGPLFNHVTNLYLNKQ